MAKIPDNAKRVFEGAIFEVYQWQQEMYDGSYATFEQVKRQDTVQIIPVIDDKLVLSSEEQPTRVNRLLRLLGGRPDTGEDPLMTAKRELLEEGGLESDSWQLYKTYGFSGKIDWDMPVFIAHNCRKVAEQSLDNGEKIDLKYVTFDEFVETVTAEGFWGPQPFIIDLLKMKLDPPKLEAFRKQLLL